eukprot:COSAG01_NODE_11229_length_1978_cov_0.929218_2_plen_183_part_01
MTFDGDIVGAVPLHVTRPIHMLLVDLGAGKDTTAILQGLGRSFPFPESQTDRNLQKLLGSYNEDVLCRAEGALLGGDAESLGRLMVEAQKAFDAWAVPACPEQLTAPWLHRLLSHAALRAHVHGGKGVGSQVLCVLFVFCVFVVRWRCTGAAPTMPGLCACARCSFLAVEPTHPRGRPRHAD